MPIHILKLIKRQEIANHTLVLTFEKPAGFTFKPGQYGGFTLIDPPETDAGGLTRRFSLLSMPEDNYLAIATRIQHAHSAFKKVLAQLPLGSTIKFAGPTGTFTLHEETSIPAVFIAGGIGITPFYSMIRHAMQHASPQPMYLFYGNQKIADAAFLNELIECERHHPSFKLIAAMADDALWQGERGFITEAMIKKYIPDIMAPIYYICGSPAMVTALQETLAEMGINEDNIKTEDFPGY